jgi:hypothetical protein
MLDDAELLLGVSRHLGTYQMSPAHAALESLQYTGQVYELAWRLKGSSLSSAARVQAIAQEAGIGPWRLTREVLPALEQLGWVHANRDQHGQLVSIDALIPPTEELLTKVPGLLDMFMTTAVQRAALALLRATSLQPLEETAALQSAAEFGDDNARDALRHLISIQLIRRVRGDDGRFVVFNPNVWIAGDDELTRTALRAEDAGARTHVGALLEEVSQSPGMPEAHVTSTEQRWIDFAVKMGLIQRSVVQTSSGDEQRFLFSPHLGRDPFGTRAGDPSGHVRQLVGSMIYASTFASWKLYSPSAFLRALIRKGVAGDVPQIGQDYPMLETAGIIEVIPGKYTDSFRMKLLQADVAEAAVDILGSREQSGSSTVESGVATLHDQRTYSHVEQERARLAQKALVNDVDARRLVDALRDTTARRTFSGR